jgi:hypothetical protein
MILMTIYLSMKHSDLDRNSPANDKSFSLPTIYQLPMGSHVRPQLTVCLKLFSVAEPVLLVSRKTLFEPEP